MNEDTRKRLIVQARAYWDDGDPVEAGVLIYEAIPLERRQEWATAILETAARFMPPMPQIDGVLDFGRHPEKWPLHRARAAHNVFGLPRNLRIDNPKPAPLLDMYLTLAENVVKVIYTTRQYPAPFDHSAGWKIASNLRTMADMLDNTTFTQAAWAALCDPPLLVLDYFVRCHPACPVCLQRTRDGLLPPLPD
jgi:hypothetical protein